MKPEMHWSRDGHGVTAMTIDTKLIVERAVSGYDWFVNHDKGGTAGGNRKTQREAKVAAEQASDSLRRRHT